MNPRTAALEGLKAWLETVQVGGAAAFADVLSKRPGPGYTEQYPRAALMSSIELVRSMQGEHVSLGSGNYAVRIGDAVGGLTARITTQDSIAGTGDAETSADAIADAILNQASSNTLTDPPGIAGFEAAISNYGTFRYEITGVKDLPLELAVDGLAEMVVTFDVEGPWMGFKEIPTGDLEITLIVEGQDETDRLKLT